MAEHSGTVRRRWRWGIVAGGVALAGLLATAATQAGLVPFGADRGGDAGGVVGEIAATGGARASVATPAAETIRLVIRAPEPATVAWHPERVVQGTIFLVSVSPGSSGLARVDGLFADERLHFRAGEDGAFMALAAAPVDAEGHVELRLEIETENDRRERRREAVPIAAGEYRMERLSVAPQFGRPQPPEIQQRISEEAARARAVSRRSHDTPRMWEPPFVPPRESRITSGFGHGRMFNDEVQSRHMGTDFAGAVGAPIRAPARGVVALVDAFYLGGNVIYIDHGAGLVTGYLHLSEQLVDEGETVEPGQVIGRVGATGRVTGPHLHWIVRYGGITVDGMSLLGLDLDG